MLSILLRMYYCGMITGMSACEVFQHFYSQLVNILPMNDVTFTAQLFSTNLLPGNVKDQVKSLATPADKATHFLDHVIKPSVRNSAGRSFNELLKVMEDSEYDDVKDLAKLIAARLKCNLVSSTKTGELVK